MQATLWLTFKTNKNASKYMHTQMNLILYNSFIFFINRHIFLLQIHALPSELSSERHILYQNAGSSAAWAAVLSHMNYTQSKVIKVVKSNNNISRNYIRIILEIVFADITVG